MHQTKSTTHKARSDQISNKDIPSCFQVGFDNQGNQYKVEYIYINK